jgi:DTW domain-containing protein YfiP
VNTPKQEGTYRESRRIRSRKAVRCLRCRYSRVVCPCDLFEATQLQTRTKVAVVAHYIELMKTTNTSRLAAACLPNSIVRGRGNPSDRESPPVPEGKRLVLFPSEHARVLTKEDASDDLILLVPDGTWGQVHRVVKRDPWFEGAEHVSLPPHDRYARYQLRMTEKENACSTLEAIALALGVLEGPHIEEPLLALFDEFVRRALQSREGG